MHACHSKMMRDVCDGISDDVTMTFRFCSSNTIRATGLTVKKEGEREGPGSRN